MGSYTQSPGRKHNGKEYKKKKANVHTTESLCSEAEVNTILYFHWKTQNKTDFSPFCCQLSIVPSDVGQEEDLAKGD